MTDVITPLTPYHDRRRPRMLILHATAVDWSQTHAIGRGQGPEVSFHYAISQAGEVVQYLDNHARAWHAGQAWWNGFDDLNSMSIGIELECICPDESFSHSENTFSDVQMGKLIPIAQQIITEFKMAPHHVLGHQDIAPYRKMDPGVNFDWAGLAAQCIGVWHGLEPQANDPVVTDPSRIAGFKLDLALYGYDLRKNKDGKDFSHVIRAFQTHFLPWNICGQVTEQSIAALGILLQKKYA